MNRIASPLLVCALAAILFAGCSATHPPLLTRAMSPEEVMQAVAGRNASVRSLRGIGEISIDTPELSNSGTISVTLTKPDSLLVDITGPFGVGVARGLVTRSDFRFYNGLENKVFLGRTNPANLKSILRIPVEFGDILDLFSGCVNFNARPAGITPRGAWSGEEYTLTFDGPEETLEYVIDASYECVIRQTRRAPGGELIEEIRLKDFHRRSDMYLPRVITLTRPANEQSLALVYESQIINELPLDFALKIPASAIKVQM